MLKLIALNCIKFKSELQIMSFEVNCLLKSYPNNYVLLHSNTKKWHDEKWAMNKSKRSTRKSTLSLDITHHFKAYKLKLNKAIMVISGLGLLQLFNNTTLKIKTQWMTALYIVIKDLTWVQEGHYFCGGKRERKREQLTHCFNNPLTSCN